MSLDGRRVVALVANEGVEQVELTTPADAIRGAGGTVTIVAPEAGTVQAFHHLDKGDTFDVDQTVEDTSAADFDALLLPGGVANPDQLRMQPKAVHLIREFVEAGKPVAVICHGPWPLIDAAVIAGRSITSWPSLKIDLVNAGADWSDEEVVVDSNGPNTIVSSRKPDDLPRFCEEMLKAFEQAPAQGAPAGDTEGAAPT